MDLSNEMVRIYKDRFGRGPTRVRSNFAGRNLIVCTLEESFAPAERRLAEMGEHQRLRELRLVLQRACEDSFREAVERLTGRKVVAFISGLDSRADLCAELFYLEPEEDAEELSSTR